MENVSLEDLVGSHFPLSPIDIEGGGGKRVEGRGHWDWDWSKTMTATIEADTTTATYGGLAKGLRMGAVAEAFLVRR